LPPVEYIWGLDRYIRGDLLEMRADVAAAAIADAAAKMSHTGARCTSESAFI
jgi:hypothetical protein